MKRSDWYLKHAKNDKYYVYEPHYIQDLKKTGPYLSKSDMYSTKNTTKFNEYIFSIPSNPNAVLEAYYGKNWKESPLETIDNLKEGNKVVYSKELFDASVYKHMKRVKIIND